MKTRHTTLSMKQLNSDLKLSSLNCLEVAGFYNIFAALCCFTRLFSKTGVGILGMYKINQKVYPTSMMPYHFMQVVLLLAIPNDFNLI